MTPGPFRLSSREAAWIVFCVTLCVTPFSFAEEMTRAMGRWAWAGMLPGFATGMLGLGALLLLRARRPDASVLEYGPELLGRFGGWVYIALLGLLFTGGAGANLRLFVDMLHTNLAASMSLWVPALVMTALASYAAFFGPELIGRLVVALGLSIIPALAVAFGLPWINSVPGRLWPLWTIPWSRLVEFHVGSSLGVCRGFLPLLLIAPAVRGGGLTRRVLLAQGAASCLIVLAFALPVAVFGPQLAQEIRFPFLDAVGTLGWSWLPIQRLGHLTMLFWEALVFLVTATYLWLASAVAGWLMLRGRWRPMVPVFGAATLILAGPVIGPQTEMGLLAAWNWAVVLLGIVVPLGLALAARPRRRPA